MKSGSILACISFLCLLFLAPAAEARTQLYGSGYQGWMDRCLKKSLVPTPDTAIEVFESEFTGRSYIAPWPDGKLAMDFSGSKYEDCQVLRHEIGHLFDWALLSSSDRNTIACRVFRRQPFRWWSFNKGGQFVEGTEGAEGPLEWFAEAYKLAATVKHLPRGRDWPFKVTSRLTFSYGVDEVINRSRLSQVRRIITKAYAARDADRSERDQRTPIAC